uniref:Uncharacterized protein n=1 Tax=Anguilla anguilla TaxID=7936 RepID=A0A0E9TJK5_ANGAN
MSISFILFHLLTLSLLKYAMGLLFHFLFKVTISKISVSFSLAVPNGERR